MTSLQFFHEQPPCEHPNPNWGTGRHGKDNLWIPRAPSWQTTGIPFDHQYKLTELKLSNVRDNDELIPRPQSVDLTKKCINKPFPAEHPYASHIEKFALIPKFDSPGDPKRGVAARQQRPISNEMPANPYKVTVVKKIRGFPYREEIITIPTEGNREPLYWQGEHFFDQQSKTHGNQQQYYPMPPKLIAPNLQDRPGELSVSERTQNVLRNIERTHWIPTQKMDYTGLGPSNPMVLDNLECKKSIFLDHGVCDDKLYPHSINTFDPARSLEGHLRKLFAPKPALQILIEDQMLGNPGTNRKMTQREMEEHKLLNGKEYVNLPERCNDPLKDMRCQEVNYNCKSEPNLELQPARKADSGDECNRQDEKGKDYLEEKKIAMHKVVQGMEAQNRWKLLQSATPSHDIIQLREKYKFLNSKEKPISFCHHEGKYNEERAGLYKTSYDPQRLAYSMNAQKLSGGTLFNTSLSHVGASLYPTALWDENECALKGSHTVVFKNNELSGDRPSSSDILNPYREAVAIQRNMLQPTVETARPLVQEGEFVLRENTYGDSYCTNKFLQERKLHRNIRIESRDLMSHDNQNLERVRETSLPCEPIQAPTRLKSVHFSDDVNIRNVHENMPVRVEESHIVGLNSAEKDELASVFSQKAASLSYTQTHPERAQSAGPILGGRGNLSESYHKPVAVPTILDKCREPVTKPPFVSFTRDSQLKVTPLSETADQFRSLSVNFLPVGLKQETVQVPHCASQLPGLDLGEKNDARFNWEPGTGQLRPQSCLLELQDSFVKSEVRKRFHQMFPESNPDIRDNFTTGKKHNFLAMNASLVHG